jgi:hypothetical protein
MSKPLLRRGIALSSLGLMMGLLALAAPSCGSTVVIGDCAGDLEDCDGVCVDLQTHPDHCGACGNPCPPGGVCSGGLCRFGCPPGHLNCFGGCVDVFSNP